MFYVDIHTHIKKSAPEEVLAVNNVMAGEGLSQSVSVYNSLGIHPWQLLSMKAKEIEKRFIKDLFIPGLVALGEAGIDRAIAVPLELQTQIFDLQADLAVELHLPLIIHAVRSYADLIHIKKRFHKASSWIVHGFAGNKQTAEQLLAHDILLSFGPSMLNEGHKSSEVISQVPISCIFLETDDSGVDISLVYNRAAQLLRLEVMELKQKILANTLQHFRIKNPIPG